MTPYITISQMVRNVMSSVELHLKTESQYFIYVAGVMFSTRDVNEVETHVRQALETYNLPIVTWGTNYNKK